MAVRHFENHEAISSALPVEDAFEAVIAVKQRGSSNQPHFHHVAYGRRYDLASEADTAAEAALNKVAEVDADGELVWEKS
jgi:hypothetical protein